MGTYSFKSSGTTQQQKIVEKVAVTPLPVGIKTPLTLGDKESILSMTYSLADQVGDNLRNLLQTNWGEHLGIYNMGANLRPLMAEFATQDDFDNAAIGRIKDAVAKWMPYVDLESFLSETDRTQNKNTAVTVITVTYNVPPLAITGAKVKVTLFAL